MQRALLVYVLILPLAVLLGYMLATPTDFNSFAIVLMAFFALSIPVLLKWHHLLLAFTWNATMIVFFLPGQPQVGIAVAFISLGIAILTRTLSRHNRFVQVPSVTIPLVILAVVVLVTAKLTGGIGARVLGGETWGAKRYLGVFGAIIGYFAFTTQAVPLHRARWYLAAFFLGGLSAAISDLTYAAGPSFYFLFILFPSDYAASAAVSSDTLMRLSGISFACAWAYDFLLGRFGFEGLFNLRAPWRLFLFVLVLGGSFLGGYRGVTILLLLTLVCQFLVERAYRKRIGPLLVIVPLIALAGMLGTISHMPLSVQRAFSFLPLEGIDPVARTDALGTLDWRLRMWKILVPEVPKYLLLGKGYSFNGTDYYLTQEAIKRGMYNAFEDTLVSGNYHNGILTLIIPFGILGFGAFLWFCAASMSVLRRNLRYGVPELRTINTFLLAYFLARLLFYLVFYGQFDLDFFQFTGTIGLSIALNGGVRSAADQVEAETVPAGELALAT
jgi:hypothetical protein